ncbi:MAG TPA: FAD-dependent oxidoreductase [Actinomycetes bacterium]|nr:FAD-dependent oxidoreductase [Actinomycetes bacterium]
MSGALSKVPVSPASINASLRDAEPRSFWLDDPEAPELRPRLTDRLRCDLLVVGGGFTGLWTAILAKQENPSLDVVLLEGERIGWAATGRNGGFVSSSLTHGLPNGADRFPDELPALIRLGEENLDAIEQTIEKFDIDAQWERTGEITAAYEPWQVDELHSYAELAKEHGLPVEVWDADRMRAEVHSPTYLGGAFEPHDTAIVNPGRLAWGLARVAEGLGVRVFERSRVTGLEEDSGVMVATTGYGQVSASKVALATNIFPNLVKRARSYVIPVWDYVLMTEPLTDAQMESIGWKGRQGIGDGGNQFHYYRLSSDNRILWGGYDAIYHFGNGLSEELSQRPESFRKLAGHFFATFPQLDGIRFTHTWGGAIDTSTRFCALWGRAYGGKVSYVLGYTGLGVAATRFGAQVMLDHLNGRRTERTELAMVKSKPIPFPPEPIKSAGIQLTRWSIAKADEQAGRRNLWLRTLDRLGLGFDS